MVADLGAGMRILAQRVSRAQVTVDGKKAGSIGRGLLLLVGIGAEDAQEDVDSLAAKVVRLRIFEDEAGKMNLDAAKAGGSVLSVPQFTLYADLSKGNRPGFEGAAPPDRAKILWGEFNRSLRKAGLTVEEGVFGAHMDVELVNDGPVTVWLDSKEI